MGLLDFLKMPRSDHPDRKAALQGRSQIYNLLDNIIGFDDDRVTPGEAFGTGLREDPVGLLSSGLQGATDDMRGLMFEGEAVQRPEDVLMMAAAPMAPNARGLLSRSPDVMSRSPDVMYSKPLLGVASDVADRGDTVLSMLKVGRGSDVTDEMLDMGDSVKNTQLNQYLFENYDLPMDEAARMARADERGMIDGLHGTMPSIYQNEGNPDIKGFEIERSTRGQSGKGIYFAPLDNYELANTFAGGRTISDADLELLDPNSPTIKGVVYPVKVKADNQANYQQMRQAQYDYEARQRAEGKSTGYAGLSDSVFDTLKPQGFSGVSQKNEFTTFYPENIRSRFARFDPRLAHLRNLSAGVGGLGLLGMSYPQEEQY